MTKVLVHIGYPKTATTWLQENFFPHIQNFRFVSWREANELILNVDSFSYNPDIVKSKLLSGDEGNILISSEFFSTAINFGYHFGYYSMGVALKLAATFPDANIVIFIRRQQSLIPSAYQQYLKNGGTYSFRRWLSSGEVFSFEHLQYDRLIDYYVSLFGMERVSIYLYESFSDDNKRFLIRFCDEHGFEVDWTKVSFLHINKGLRIFCLPLLKAINHFYKKPVGRKRYVCHIPGMTTVGRGIIKYLNPLPVFGRYLREDDFLRSKDLEYIKKFYSSSNRNLTNYFKRHELEKYGYYL